MALVLADRVKETTTTTGTGTYTLAGAVASFESFASVGDGNTTYYACTDGTDFEVGVGTYTASGTTLARTSILQSSNSDAAVNWGSGTKTIFVTQPAEKAVFEDVSGNVAIANNITLGGTVDGRDIASDGTKLDSIETGATADQTASEIKTAYESNADTNAFTDTLLSKLNNIEAGATADQTAAEIRALVEAATDSNVFTDADHSKLDGIETGATADQTKSDIDALGINADQVDGLEASQFLRSDAADTATGRITMSGASFKADQDSITSSATTTIDLNVANHFVITMTQNTTLSLSNISNNVGSNGNIIFVQNATGGYSFTLDSNMLTPVNGATIVQNTGPNEISILSYHVLSATQVLVNYIGDFA